MPTALTMTSSVGLELSLKLLRFIEYQDLSIYYILCESLCTIDIMDGDGRTIRLVNYNDSMLI